MDRSTGFSSLPTLLLVYLALAAFLFYGVVGADKTWLLAPVYMVSYLAITVALVGKALSIGRGASASLSTKCQVPPTTFLWLLFLIYGLFLIPSAAIPFESKLVLLFLGSVVGAYLVWGFEFITFKNNRMVLGLLIFMVMLAALYGLIVHFKCPEWVLWLERYAVYEGRLMSTYICPNHFAHLMQMLLPFCLALLFIPQSGLYLKILSVYSFLVFLPPLFLTESRAGWLGSIAAIGVCGCLMALRRSKKLFTLLVVLVPLCSILLLLGGWQYSETFQRRMTPVVEFLEGQADEGIGSESRDFRPQTWMDTIDMIKDAPLIGHGPGNYRYTFPEYRNRFKGHRIVTGHPHNEYLELIADYGLIGFALFAVAWLYGCIWLLIKSLKAKETRHAFLGFAFLGTVAGTMVHSFFDFQMHVYPNALIFALLAAIAVGPLCAVPRKERRPKADRQKGFDEAALESATREAPSEFETSGSVKRFFGNVLAWLLAVGYMLLTIFCLQTMSSSYLRALADKAAYAKEAGPGSRQSAERLYRWSIRIDAQNWRAYKGMADLQYKKRYYSIDMAEKVQLAEIERHWYELAYRYNPKDPEMISSLGKTYIFLGKRSSTQPSKSISQKTDLINEGLALLRKACDYRKFNDTYWWTLGVELRKAGFYEEALEVFLQAEKLKATPSTKMNIQWVRRQLTEQPEKEQPTSDVKGMNLHLESGGVDLLDLLELMSK